jgi:hypothetical protein
MIVCNDALYVSDIYAFHSPCIEDDKSKRKKQTDPVQLTRKKKLIIGVTKQRREKKNSINILYNETEQMFHRFIFLYVQVK